MKYLAGYNISLKKCLILKKNFMKTNHIKKLNMLRVLLAYLADNKASWENLPVFVEAVEAITALVKEIEAEAGKQIEITKGITLDKELKKAEMVKAALKVSSAGKAWAARNKNLEMKTAFGTAPSKLAKKKDIDCSGICKNIHSMASPLMPELAAYGIVASDLEGLDATIVAFHEVVSAPQLARTEGKNATAQLDGLFDEADTILHDTLDPIAMVLKDANHEFYAGLQNARYIGGNRNRKKESEADDNLQ